MKQIQYAVCHLQKGSGNDAGMACHIERKNAKGERYVPVNADPSRTHLNRELVAFPEGMRNRTEAIQHRIDNAGLHRKVGKNQVRAVRIILTGTHEQMMEIEHDGKLDDWVAANMDWLRETFGAENLVSCVLHMDEKTPHLHATVVPIVSGERKRREREGKRKYETRTGNRLCCDEVMARWRMKGYQDSYAAAMKRFGLERGIVGSTAQHKAKSEHLKELVREERQLEEDIERLQAEAEKAREGRSTFFSLFGKGDLAKARKEIGDKDAEIRHLERQIGQLRGKLQEVARQKDEELAKLRGGYQLEIDTAIKRVEAAEKKAEEQERAIAQKNERIEELHRAAYPERHRLSSGASLEGLKFFDCHGIVSSIMIWTKVGEVEHRATSNRIYSDNFARYCKGELTAEELVNICFKPEEQVNEHQLSLLATALELATGGPAQTHVGTGGGGSSDQSPWNDEHKRKRKGLSV